VHHDYGGAVSQALPFRKIAPELPSFRRNLRAIKLAREAEDWKVADLIRKELLAVDDGMKVTISKDGKVSLWHWPNPPFSDHLHYCNYGEFIANSEEE
jgi:hypothetical protein